MRHLCLLMLCFLLLSLSNEVHGQRFPCDGRLAIATQHGGSTLLSYRLQIPFGPELFSPWVSYADARFDALGFNSRDNYIYAVQEGTNAIVRLQHDGIYDTVGIVNEVDTLKSFAGDCTPEGLYLCHDSELDQILVFNVLDEFEIVDRINLFWDPNSAFSGNFTASIFDFAINPLNSTVAYSYIGSYDHPDLSPVSARGKLVRINLDFTDDNVGMVSPISTLNADDIIHLGGLLYSSRGELFGYGTDPRAFGGSQNRFITIDPSFGEVSIFHNSLNPPTAISDGFTCPYSFSFTNLAPAEGIYCGGDTKDFVLKINNDSFDEFQNLTLTDTMAEGMLIENVRGSFNSNEVTIDGIGSRFLTLSNLNIQARSEVEIIIQARTVDIEVGFTDNQAFLHDLPEKFGGVMPSDDPWTIGIIGDPSFYIIIPWSLEDVSWEVFPPTDCLNGNDGKMIITSPDFIIGQEYQIKLRNKIGWEESTYLLVADNNRSLFIDSLVPGDYELYDFKPIDVECSLSLRDTTILISAPNEQLLVSAKSNSPICEGEELRFNSSISPEAEKIRWYGTDISFASAEPDPIRINTRASQSGEYILKVEYGKCEISDTIEVFIAPGVNGAINGKTEYCRGESLDLLAEGTGETLTFDWTGPNNFISSRENISNSGMQIENEGLYEVIIDNGGCQDTLSADLTVLSTPSVSLPDFIKTDYCAPLQLEPDILEDENAVIVWEPALGLNCADCPSPQVEPIVQSSYQLKVKNANNCSDSAKVRIILDEEELFNHPNAFKPNSLNDNSHFTLYPKCVINTVRNISVYNRWGQEVFSNSDITDIENSNFWDGYIQGELGQPGVYIWIAEVQLVDGSLKTITGDVTLIN